MVSLLIAGDGAALSDCGFREVGAAHMPAQLPGDVLILMGRTAAYFQERPVVRCN